MNLNRECKAAAWMAGLALAAGLAGCRVQVNKGANGQDKSVQVDTPFGGVHVNTDQTTAADLGLPVYPGAVVVKDKDNNQSADIHMGFGEWQMHVKVVSYQTPDAQDKVTAFYKKALERYSSVIACAGNVPIGSPTVTTEGLTCADDGGSGHNINVDTGNFKSGQGLELKAGSKHDQHIVGFCDSKSGQTRFALVSLELPNVNDSGSGKSD